MSKAQIIDLIILFVTFSTGAIVLLAAYRKLPKVYQDAFDTIKMLSPKANKIMGSIMLINSLFIFSSHIDKY